MLLRLAEGIRSPLLFLPQIALDDVGTPIDCSWLGISGSLQMGTYVFRRLLSLSEQRGPGMPFPPIYIVPRAVRPWVWVYADDADNPAKRSFCETVIDR